MASFPKKSSIQVVEVPKLSAEEFLRRRLAADLTQAQLTMLTDISRNRIARVERGETASLMRDEDGTFFVPRALTLALIGVEEGRLRV